MSLQRVMSHSNVLIAESGERFAISMAISVILAELDTAENGTLSRLHARLSEHIEISLGHAADQESDLDRQDTIRAMSAHASDAVVRMFVMGKRLGMSGP